ncbi:hypothetical protein F2P81_009866 [Scophthalmus maximus]|uniref:Uncharacterized protein n=1 Tax=Scophthalmus maximus TaxID=52904 RepID=A0A6A4T486_SCOMX|nr:hypothetical protein F2P81_009866 [Scophthalmus maximus]
MEFSSPPVLLDTSPSLRRRPSPPCAADWSPAAAAAVRQVSASGPPESRWAGLESPEPAGSAAAGQQRT